jgi:cytoskeletal protein RodZ
MTNEYSEDLRAVFSQIGERLKADREAAGLSLQEVSARTRINQSFLGLIEVGDMDSLPSLAFVKGFIRNYMDVLELSDEVVEEELGRLNALDGKDLSIPSQSPNPNLLDTEPGTFPFLKVGVGAALVILILVIGFFLIRGPDDETTGDESVAVETTESASDAAAGTSGDSGNEEGSDDSSNPAQSEIPPATGSQSTTSSAKTPSTPVEGRQKLELTIRGLEQTWVRLSLDRAPPIDVLIEPAETVGWEASQEFLLTLGKSHGVAIYLNGEEFLIPKEKNQLVRELVLNKLTLLRLEN